MTQVKTFLKFKVTPKSAGSVVPRIAVIPAVMAVSLSSTFLDLRPTAKAAAPWAMLDGRLPGQQICSKPCAAIDCIIKGTMP